MRRYRDDRPVDICFARGTFNAHPYVMGAMGAFLDRLDSPAVAALYADLKDRADDVVILTMTEFGRTARENGNRGTDHGHASVMFALGGSIHGGKVHGKWPGLKSSQLYEGRDLAVTTDFRDVFAEIARGHMGISNLNAIFPGYQANPANFRGLLRS